MSAQLNADVITLSAALYRVKKQLGTDRFAAAQMALQEQRAEKHQRGAVPPSGGDPDQTTASSAPNADSTLALLRAAGIGRFRQ